MVKLRQLRGLLKVFSASTKKDLNYLKDKLVNLQHGCYLDPQNVALKEEEKKTLLEYTQSLQFQNNILKQKARLNWMKEGDTNSKFFHRCILARRNNNRISSILDDDGISLDDQPSIKVLARNYFLQLIGNSVVDNPSGEVLKLMESEIDQNTMTALIAPITTDEVKDTLFAMHPEKAPGPDGFTAKFFQATWGITGGLVIEVVQEFFHTSKMNEELNETFICLVPKVQVPSQMCDYRPISCCNTIYKVISKILARRLKLVACKVVNIAQSAFIPGRSIEDNIMLMQELTKDYRNGKKIRSCMIKVDFLKAFDSVKWEFIQLCLQALHLPQRFINWIMACISTATFSVLVNGEASNRFKVKKGIRQGDPLSPYLFALVMEGLSKILGWVTASTGRFKPHHNCQELGLHHLIYADDLLLFCKAEGDSLGVLMSILASYGRWSGLVMNTQKSSMLVSSDVAEGYQLAESWGLRLQDFPFRYLGTPITVNKPKYSDCLLILEKLKKRILAWQYRSLSYAGRVTLIISVLSSYAYNVMSLIALPRRITKEMDRIIKSFLWTGDSLNAKKAKVKWEEVTLPKVKGGLGIKSVQHTQKVQNCRKLWKLITTSEALWIKWIHEMYIKGGNLWTTDFSSASWLTRQWMNMRTDVYPFIKQKVGNGENTWFWFDNWINPSPLAHNITFNSLLNRIPSNHRVSTLIHQGTWLVEFRGSNLLIPFLPPLPNQPEQDYTIWTPSKQGKFTNFSCYEMVRPSAVNVHWYPLVWKASSCPKASFITWLAIKDRLKTKDHWKNSQDTLCPLCKQCRETRSHIFFSCTYAKGIWNKVLQGHWPGRTYYDWDRLLPIAIQQGNRKGPEAAYFKAAFCISIYSVWKERNKRVHGLQETPKYQLASDTLNFLRACLFAKASV